MKMFLVDYIVKKIVDALLSCTVRQCCYVVHYNQNRDDFASEVKKLIDTKTRVERRIAHALANNEVVEDKVSEWLTQVQSSLKEDMKILVLQGEENVQCLDVLSRYRMARERNKKLPLLTRLIEEGNFDTVAYSLTTTRHDIFSVKNDSVPSRDLVFQKITDAIKDDNIYKIGIHGMPGVGKTRMVEEVAKQAQKEGLFDDIGKTVVTQNLNLKDIQLKLAESLNLNLDKETDGARKELLHNRLKNGKKILVMVDDIWNDRIKLEDIGIPAEGDYTPGCKVVLTSWREDVCEDMGVNDPFQIGLLSEDEARSLFQKKVGDFIDHPEMLSIAKEVCGECAGLPLAILAVGGALKYKKSKQEWQDALDQLRDSSGNNIGERTAHAYCCIKLSYDYLEPTEAKSIFLLCCLFPEDADIPIDDLVMYAFARRLLRRIYTMKEARNIVHTLINTLKAHSLLLEGKNDEFVKMHDVIQDVGISIASVQEDDIFLVKSSVDEWPEEGECRHCGTISLQLNGDCVLPYESQCPELRSLKLEGNGDNSSSIPSSIFDGMEKLEVLDLHGIRIRTLPSSLKNLRMLRLDHCGSVNLAFLRELEKLEILIIGEFTKQLAPEISLLSRLRLLDLRHCYGLKMIPPGIISSLSQLEELYIPREFDQWEVNGNASLSELKSLRRLTSLEIYIPQGMLLPLDELQCKSLITFRIYIGCMVYNTEKRIFTLRGSPLKAEYSILLEKAQVLSLEKVEGLKDLFHNREQMVFPDLMNLDVFDCDGVEHLFRQPNVNSEIQELCASASFSNLRKLSVWSCGMRSLFSATIARSLAQLQTLDILYCDMLEEIISYDQEAIYISFPGLKELTLVDLPNLRGFFANKQALFNDKVRFPALETLEIKGLEIVTEIWDNQSFPSHGFFQQLKRVTVEGCHEIVNVIPPNAVPWFQNLDQLKVRSCHSVVSIVEVAAIEEGSDEILLLPQLSNLTLTRLPNLRGFFANTQALFNDKVRFLALETLEIKGLGSVTEIWDNQSFPSHGFFQQLKRVTVEGCHKIVNVIPPNVVPWFQNLDQLKVRSCHSVVSVVEVAAIEEGSDEILMLPQLSNLTLTRLPNLRGFFANTQALFNDKVRFPALETLEIKGLESVTEIWDNQSFPSHGFFQQLKRVTVEDCHKILNVIPPNAVPWFQNLDQLKVRSCHSVVSVVEVAAFEEGRILVFPQLNNLTLGELPRLGSFCCSRREMVVGEGNIHQLQEIFHHKVEFPILTSLSCDGSIFECSLLDHLVTGFFTKIRFLEVLQDRSLVNASTLLQYFEVVEEITVSACCSVEVIFKLDGLAKERHAIVSSRTKKLRLWDLPKLERIWVTNPEGLLVFHNLTSLEIEKCDSLMYLFSCSIARCLTQLRKLKILSCYAMEEIVRSEGQGEEDDMEEIVFPQLQDLCIRGLLKFTCFCRKSNAFNFPSLEYVDMSGCPKLETFTFGYVSTPAIKKLYINHWMTIDVLKDDVNDLNRKVSARVLKQKGKPVDSDGELSFAEIYVETKDSRGSYEDDILLNQNIHDAETSLDEAKEKRDYNEDEYEVFLSFSGEDTCKALAISLCGALNGAGVCVFGDIEHPPRGKEKFTDVVPTGITDPFNRMLRGIEDPPKGDETGTKLVTAIRKSKISIPFLSKTYASSKRCLDELSQMVECKRSMGQLILPIFYDVFDVKHQSGSYEDIFRRHAKRFGERAVMEWKETLREVGELKGWDLNKEFDWRQGGEDFITKTIVPTVLLELKKNYMAATAYLVGMDYHVNQMMQLLKFDSSEVRIVGIHGISGIGKTTIAKIIYNMLLERFECCSFLTDVQELVQQNKGVVCLQKQLLADILKRCPGISDVDSGIDVIKNIVPNKKVLLVLDDLGDSSHFAKLVGKRDWFGSGSRIIITTKDRHVIDDLKVDAAYEPPLIDSEQSVELFSMHAFRRKFPPIESDKISKELASTVAGIPLALEVVGSFLSGMEKAVWEDTLMKLKRMLHEDVEKKLRVIYEALTSAQQQIFLDIASLFNGRDKTAVFYMWNDYGYNPEMELNLLRLMSLVKVGDANKLSMHQQLRALGRNIVNEEKVRGNRSRLWNHEDALNIVAGWRGTEKVEALTLHFDLGPEKKPRFTSEEFSKLVNLRYLQVDGTDLVGDFEELLPNLRWLDWRRCSSQFKPTNFHLKNLVVLDLSDSGITEDWEGWDQIKMAKKLKVLQLANCALRKTPDLSSYAALEILILRCCKSLVEVDRSIGNLKNLKVFDASHSDIRSLPDEIWMLDKLEVLDFTHCGYLKGHIPSNMGSLTSLRFLSFFGTKIQSLPTTICELSCLQTLKLGGCTDLQSQPNFPPRLKCLDVACIHNETNLVNLQELHFIGENVEKPISIGNYSQLKKLTFDSTNIRTLPLEITYLHELKELDIQSCHDLECILGLPSSLDVLSLAVCYSLERLPNLSNLEYLLNLSLRSCTKLAEVRGLGKLKSLQRLNIYACDRLANLDLLEHSSSEIRECIDVEEMPTLSKLEMVSITYCPELKSIQGLDKLKSLKCLVLHGCLNLREMEVLEALESSEVPGLSRLIPSLYRLWLKE